MMCLRFVFLLITRVEAWLRLSRREDTWKTAEILILRHQVTVLHYDTDFDLIATVTGQPTQWVVPRGSVA